MVTTNPLAAILVADLVGYSQRMKADEAGTLSLVERAFARAQRCSQRFGGRVVKTTGDGWIALFDSVTAAVDCAEVLQRLMQRTPATSEAAFRMSVHVGEVRHRQGDIFGHAVNVAVRMQALAEPGGVVVSQNVVTQLDQSPGYRFETLGHPMMKNIGDDVAVYRAQRLSRSPPASGAQGVRLRLRILGEFAIVTADDRQVALKSAHAAALVGALALDPEQPVASDRLAVMLWPDKPLSAARASLARTRRYVNSRLAHAVPNFVAARGTIFSLNLAGVEIDLQETLHRLDEGTVAPALMHSTDAPAGLLAGLGRVSPVFQAWLRVRRSIWRDRLIARLEGCLERLSPAQEATHNAAAAILRLEPGHEPASIALMRHLAARGRKEAALREFNRLKLHLAENYETEPGSEAVELARSLRGARVIPAAARGPSQATHIPQIAVGAFEAEGLAEQTVVKQFRAELIANLSRFRGWAVLDVADDAVRAADYSLRALYEPADPEAQLTIRLVEPRTGRIAWSETFPLSSSLWRQRQGQVVGRVASVLEIYISADRLSRSIGAVPAEGEDYDDWLRGESLLLQWTARADAEAEEIFGRLIRRTPGFAPAYASLASILNVRHILQPGRPRAAEDAANAQACAMQAVELDPMDARNHLALAWGAALAGKFDQAAVHLDLAASLNPYSPNTMISAAMGYAFLGDHRRAGTILDAAIELSPMLRPHQWCYAAAVRFLGGDPAAAEAAALRSGDQIVDNQGWLAVALERQGRGIEARLAFVRLQAAVASTWAGSGPCDAAAVHDWFISAYPIRNAADRDTIAEALSGAMPQVGAEADRP